MAATANPRAAPRIREMICTPQTVARYRRPRCVAALPSLGDVLSDALARAQAAKPAKKAGKRSRRIAASQSGSQAVPPSYPVPPSHPLLGDGIEADDLLIEIASWLTPEECSALAACRRRYHALASFTELLLPWRWVWRRNYFAPLQPSIHARRWQLPLQRWRDRAMARAERVTIEMHFHRSDSEGVRPFVVRYDPDYPETITTGTSLWIRIRRRTRVSRLASLAVDRFNSLELWPDTISIELSRSDGSTVGIFGPGDAHEPWTEADATPRVVVGPRFPLDMTADEKLVLVAHFG